MMIQDYFAARHIQFHHQQNVIKRDAGSFLSAESSGTFLNNQIKRIFLHQLEFSQLISGGLS